MEEMKNGEHHNHDHGEMCSHKDCCKDKVCGTGRCGCGMKYPVLRWILGIIIIFALLGLGIKIGEFKVMCDSGLYRTGFSQNIGFGPTR